MHAETLFDASDPGAPAAFVDDIVAAPTPRSRAYRDATVREKIDRLIMLIDRTLSEQVNVILHHPRFQALEAR